MSDLPETAVGPTAARSVRIVSNSWAGSLLSLTFLGFVALCLIIPLAQTIHPLVPSIVRPLEERREATQFPSFEQLLGANGNFAQALNDWFDDRVGFRDLFIRTKNQIDYSLFSTSRKVFIGKDGWLFGRGGIGAVEHLSPAKLTALESRFVQLANRLQEKGIRLIVVGYPDKSQIYPEMTSAQMRVIPDGGNFDRLRHFLASQTSLTFIDGKELMRQERLRTPERLFAKTDMHPTEIGQLPVVKEIVTQIARLEGRADMPWEDFSVQHHSLEDWGGDARLLSLLSPVPEPSLPTVANEYQVGGDEPDGKWTIPDRITFERADDGVGRPFDWEFRSNPDVCSQRLPGTVLFGNSFSDLYWVLGLHRHFCFIRRTRDPMSRFKLFYQTMPADTKYMIYEFVSFWLPETAPPDDYAE